MAPRLYQSYCPRLDPVRELDESRNFSTVEMQQNCDDNFNNGSINGIPRTVTNEGNSETAIAHRNAHIDHGEVDPFRRLVETFLEENTELRAEFDGVVVTIRTLRNNDPPRNS